MDCTDAVTEVGLKRWNLMLQSFRKVAVIYECYLKRVKHQCVSVCEGGCM